MPGRIVVAHDEPRFRQRLAGWLMAAGHEVQVCAASMDALDILERPGRIDVLITRVAFPAGQPNGISLARMARLKRSGIEVIFAGRAENGRHTDGLGAFLATPLSEVDLLTAVDTALERRSARQAPVSH
jgi:DNA-binding NtrC family response regulator